MLLSGLPLLYGQHYATDCAATPLCPWSGKVGHAAAEQ